MDTNTGATLPTTWPEFKEIAASFFRATDPKNEKPHTAEETEAGFKCLSLAFLGLTAEPYENHQAALLMRMASERVDWRQLDVPKDCAL